MLEVLNSTSVNDATTQMTTFFSKENLMNLVTDFCNWAVGAVGTLVLAIVIWIIGKKIIKAVGKFLRKVLDRGKLDEGVKTFVLSAARVLLYIFLFIIVVDTLGFQTTSLITLLGTGALAIGMSLQGSLSNFAGGVLILIFKPFTIGDYIVVQNSEGSVVSIGILYTKLRTVDNKVIMLPNGTLSNSNITNVGAENLRRLDIEVGISYEADIKDAKRVLSEIIAKRKNILTSAGKEPRVVVKSLDDSCVTLETRTWLKTEDYWDTKFELLEEYKEELEKNNISIPYNQMDVHIIK
ncbi:mechanosensitive ion channel family protein [Lachnospira pectinoschiza]|uniref:Small conductance mechanosensitive channel n=1 Tax=Lachnospira pectinoschiza TaxID=28052 RepID=A0A1G9Z4E1_9FIRM|nr:mechanosensitive ion channel family protein [Lachnospira pectinoschiza]SDN16358.1 small conductance mechanosensitive channel [Lachnospira pectinoschiza]